MAILANKKTRVIVQGITGQQGSFHTRLMLDYGTNIVAGVTPGKKGQNVYGVPVFDTVKEIFEYSKANISIIFVPAPFVKKAAFEALKNNLHLVIVTENVPVHDTLDIIALAKEKKKIVIGPNCPGIISPGKCKIGIMPAHIFKKGSIGMISRSGTLTYEIVNELSRNNLGQSTVVGVGGDSVVGTSFITILKYFRNDKNTSAIVLIGEIGGSMEEQTAEFLKDYPKPVVVYIAGRNAPEGKRMGHAGAIISGGKGTAKTKIKAFEKAGIRVAILPSEIVKLLAER